MTASKIYSVIYDRTEALCVCVCQALRNYESSATPSGHKFHPFCKCVRVVEFVLQWSSVAFIILMKTSASADAPRNILYANLLLSEENPTDCI